MKLQTAFFALKFENLFLRTKGDAFQTFFENLMKAAYKENFWPCRPWGNQGDLKNDGYLKSERALFQVYAPYELEAKKLVAKIKEDFAGAKLHWQTYLDSWVFVHNGAEGIPPHAQRILLELQEENPLLRIEAWGLEDLQRVFHLIALEDLTAWLGPAPDDEIQARLGFDDLRVVLEALAIRPSEAGAPPKIIPPGKIAANALSESVAFLIKSGMTKAPLVSSFFEAWHDETLAERLAEAFRNEYLRLRPFHSPNRIFSELQEWTGGNQLQSADHQMAVLAVLAYYFERCDIFEEPRSGT